MTDDTERVLRAFAEAQAADYRPERPGSIAEALALLQTQLPEIKKGSQAQYGSYADLADVSKALLPVMGELGLSFSAKPTWVKRPVHDSEGRVVGESREFVLAYQLRHVSGEHDDGEYPLGTNVANHQALGSAITYGRRYCLCAITGAVADADDDGQAASEPSPPRGRAKPPPRPASELPRNRDGAISRGKTTDDEKAAAGIMTGEQQGSHNALERDVLGIDSKGRTRNPQGEHLDAAPAGDQWLLPPYEGPESPQTPVRQPRAAQPVDKRIIMHFDRFGITDRDVRLGYTAILAGRDALGSTKELTAVEGLAVEKALARCKDREAFDQLLDRGVAADA